jgi:integrase/recombinase XerD
VSVSIVTIFVRHGLVDGKPCKYADDETSKRCSCPKHLRWTRNGKQFRKSAGTRSWAEAERSKRGIEDQLEGKTPESKPEGKGIQECVAIFITDKRVQGITTDVLNKYTRELDRLRDYCERHGIYTIAGVSRELLTGYCATWKAAYPSSYTRSKVRERVGGFLRYCYEAQWVPRIPALPKIKVDEPPTMPLTADEYARLLTGIPTTVKHAVRAVRVRALYQLMRWSGLAIQDALTLGREEIQHDEARRIYRVVTSRQKTGVHVSVPIPPEIAKEILATPNTNPKYVFWAGTESVETLTRKWSKYYVAPVFKAAGLYGVSHMTSHRLRDTFAVDLLEKGVPLEEVSKLLGHESIKTTEKHYAKWVKGRQDRLDALVTGTWDAA